MWHPDISFLAMNCTPAFQHGGPQHGGPPQGGPPHGGPPQGGPPHGGLRPNWC